MNISGLDNNQVQAMHDPIQGADVIDDGPGRVATEHERRALSEQRRLRRPAPYQLMDQPMAVDAGPGISFEEVRRGLSAVCRSRHQVGFQIDALEDKIIEVQLRLGVAHAQVDYADEIQTLKWIIVDITQQLNTSTPVLMSIMIESQTIREIVFGSSGSSARLERLRDITIRERAGISNLLERCDALTRAHIDAFAMVSMAERGMLGIG